ncbi:tetraacyldisaccharide 4'-kinase [Bordetella genomosp. 8]|uniref:Tetraacyldisaccharide 4'-kinase n=1 Tax=Bordetella genomosp. 8 TaxID=1416806 RepID=A0A1W6YMZ2_9BORD|nr:tetraacyldisaccharide 4'-kinase [Bordetella genomosp. 8]ARP82425.1 tetraacyldisaccharide 4'-kinase [Bordetella genomosp. 8]
MSQGLREVLQSQWQHGGWLARLLGPLSFLTLLAVQAKRACYRRGWLKSYRPPVPVIVVGNIYVGGTGKTPVVIALVQALRERGWTPGVVSRGYGVKIGNHPRTGQGELAAERFGDEPALISHATNAPVSIHPDRPRAVRTLLSAFPNVDVIVSDDGLQHLALARDVEIVVQDGRGVGNGRLLPAGPLREPATRLREVHTVVTNVDGPVAMAPAPAGKPYRVSMWMEPGAAWNLREGTLRTLWELQAEYGRAGIAAAAGIGNPERFFATLRSAGVSLNTTVPLPDHYSYARSPFASVKTGLILVTAKDAVKCSGLGDNRLWAVPVTPHFSDPAFFDRIAERLPAPGAKAASAPRQ